MCVCVYTYIHMCIYVCRCQFLTSAAMFGLWGSSWLYLVWAYFDILWVVYFSYTIRIQQQTWKQVKLLVPESLLQMEVQPGCESELYQCCWEPGFQRGASFGWSLGVVNVVPRQTIYMPTLRKAAHRETTESESQTWNDRGKMCALVKTAANQHPPQTNNAVPLVGLEPNLCNSAVHVVGGRCTPA